LFAAENVKTGDFILEYLGEVLHEDEYHARKQKYQDEGRSHYYFMTLSSSETIDATIRGNSGRFLNHSCAPNCETQKWMVRGELCIGIFATRDIAAGEELTIDYKFERFGEKPSRCFCMAGACCGWIGGAKAAEAAKSYSIDSDDEEGHENDLEPVMHELDDAQIAAEEAKGRELMAGQVYTKEDHHQG
jgi:histone-lysine N-methyltransferase SETD2